ncbi:hypothetical protein ACHHYP_20388 [Achlya hypogyna]|uniref:Uncharacterized protein n=1 Tax=Achlya hypogyna TaxID=1202772 RepID=A0A1V9ZJU4_ACHHY|nr:hypothetical protein ACHHYP_20388 [Achlya hypogyna]
MSVLVRVTPYSGPLLTDGAGLSAWAPAFLEAALALHLRDYYLVEHVDDARLLSYISPVKMHQLRVAAEEAEPSAPHDAPDYAVAVQARRERVLARVTKAAQDECVVIQARVAQVAKQFLLSALALPLRSSIRSIASPYDAWTTLHTMLKSSPTDTGVFDLLPSLVVVAYETPEPAAAFFARLEGALEAYVETVLPAAMDKSESRYRTAAADRLKGTFLHLACPAALRARFEIWRAKVSQWDYAYLKRCVEEAVETASDAGSELASHPIPDPHSQNPSERVAADADEQIACGLCVETASAVTQRAEKTPRVRTAPVDVSVSPRQKKHKITDVSKAPEVSKATDEFKPVISNPIQE